MINLQKGVLALSSTEMWERFSFYTMQAILVFGALFLIQWIASVIPVVGTIFNALVSLAAIVLWVVLKVKAYQGESYKLPIVGEFAEKNS